LSQVSGEQNVSDQMNYARVISLNFRSADDLEIFYHKWDNWFPENMPIAISRTLVKTAENSTLMVAVYETEEIAERARKIVENFFQMETQRIHDIIEFHGEVMK
jgi:hypothetical protein